MANKVDIRYVSYYTAGSAAQKIAPAVPLKTMKLPRIKSKKRIVVHIDPVAIGGIVMAAVLFVLLAVGVSQLRSARQETAQMAAYVDTLQVENSTLRTQFEASYDLQTVEKTALALGMVPVENVQRISIHVPEEQTQQHSGAWEKIFTFLTGLFA